MTQIVGTFSSYDAVGNREDLTDVIYDISPTETPFFSSVAKTKAKAAYHEWQTDSLTAASGTNIAVEGDEASFDSITATVRRGNYTQISDKAIIITGTQEAVDHAGRDSEMNYQTARRGLELRRDMESSLVGVNNARVAGDDTTGRELASYQSWVATNVDKAGDGTNPTGDGTDARGDGTQRALTEQMLKTVLQLCWTEGGNPTMIMCGAFNKQVISGFQGNATRYQDAAAGELNAGIDVYKSDFGVLKVVPNRFSRSRDVLIIDKDYWAVATLRPIQRNELAITGDARKYQLLVEYTLEARNQKSSGIIADLTTS